MKRTICFLLFIFLNVVIYSAEYKTLIIPASGVATNQEVDQTTANIDFIIQKEVFGDYDENRNKIPIVSLNQFPNLDYVKYCYYEPIFK